MRRTSPCGAGPPSDLDGYLPNIPKAMVAFLATVSTGGVWSICAPDMGTAAVLAELCAALPSVQHVILHDNLGLLAAGATPLAAYVDFTTATASNDTKTTDFEPLWLALKSLHHDVGCSYDANSLSERYHWYSSTGWVMWNAQVSGLLSGTTCCIFDGSPGGATVGVNSRATLKPAHHRSTGFAAVAPGS